MATQNLEKLFEAASKNSNRFTYLTLLVLCTLSIFTFSSFTGLPFYSYENSLFCPKEGTTVGSPLDMTNTEKCHNKTQACFQDSKRGVDYLLVYNYTTAIRRSFVSEYNLECEDFQISMYPMLFDIAAISGLGLAYIFINFFSTKALFASSLALSVSMTCCLTHVRHFELSYVFYFFLSQSYHVLYSFIPIYLTEFSTARTRALCISLFMSCHGMSGLYSFLIFYYFKDYRIIFQMTYPLVLMVLILVLGTLKESIRFNMIRGRIDMAEKVLEEVAHVNSSLEDYLRCRNKEKAPQVETYQAEIERSIEQNSNEAINTEDKGNKDLYSDMASSSNTNTENLTATTLAQHIPPARLKGICSYGSVIKLIIIFAMLTMLNEYTVLLIELGFIHNGITDVERYFYYAMEIISPLFVCMFLDWKVLGRKRSIFFLMTLLWVFFLMRILIKGDMSKWLLVVLKILQILFEASNIVWINESFPTAFRRTSVVIIKVIGRVVNIPGPFFIEHFQMASNMIAMSVIVVAFFLIALLDIKETVGCKIADYPAEEVKKEDK